MDNQRSWILMLFFTMTCLLINLFTIVSTDTETAQINSLLKSKYIYSATASKSILKDDYYQFDAGIGFSVSPDNQTGINATVLMQNNKTKYSADVDWNSDRLKSSGVAITRGIARKKHLTIGDRLYSNHIVDGTMHEYTVEQILPELSEVRLSENRIFSEGIIIMGYDETYVENISHKTLLFTSDSIEEVASSLSENPLEIIYRSDEIRNAIKRILPYVLLFMLLSALATAVLVLIIKRNVGHNFKRLLILGFDERNLNASYMGLIYTIGMPSVVIAWLISVPFSHLFIFSSVELMVLSINLITEIFTLLIFTNLSKRQMWR